MDVYFCMSQAIMEVWFCKSIEGCCGLQMSLKKQHIRQWSLCSWYSPQSVYEGEHWQVQFQSTMSFSSPKPSCISWYVQWQTWWILTGNTLLKYLNISGLSMDVEYEIVLYLIRKALKAMVAMPRTLCKNNNTKKSLTNTPSVQQLKVHYFLRLCIC